MTKKSAILFFLLLTYGTLFAQFESSSETEKNRRAMLEQQQPVTDEYLSSVDANTFTRLILEVMMLGQGHRADSIANYLYRKTGDRKGYSQMLIAISHSLLTWGNDYSSAVYFYQKGVSLLPEDAQTDVEVLQECLEFWNYYGFYLNEDDAGLLRKSWDAAVQSNLLLIKLYIYNLPQADDYTKLKLLNTYYSLYQKTLELYDKMSKALLLTPADRIHWAEYSLFWESMRNPSSTLPLTFEEIQQRLQPGELAVHFAYQETNLLDLDAVAIIIPHQGEVHSVPLDLNRALFIPLLRNDNFPVSYDERREEINYPHDVGAYFHYFWKPFYDNYPDTHTIYYSAIGQIGFLSHAALSKDIKSSTYLCDEKDMRLLSSLNELGQKPSSSPLNDIAIFGDINYYNQVVENALDSTVTVRRTVINRADKLMRLPFSQYEVNQLKLLLANHKIKSNYYTNRRATEKAFRALSGNSPQVIHLSTHGFYIDDVPYTSSGISFLEEDQTVELQRRIEEQNRACGLFLAGAGQSWNNKGYAIDKGDDGVLTAGEIATMDLSGTELVVLSACNTGIGHLERTQNVVGLWRAFKQAGVKSILMTLWEVDDEVAAQMMLQFYTYWLETSDRYEAFKKAQKNIRQRYPEPYHWGAFVLMD